MPKVNPSILRWARETAGLNLEDAAEKVGLGEARGVAGSDRLAMLEAGDSEPTRPMLLKMAAQYRRPLLTFYLAEPPSVAARGEDFRTLPAEFAKRDAALVDTLLREVRARQEMVRAVLETEDEATPLDFVGSFDQGQGAEALATAIRTRLAFDLQTFRHGNGRGTPKGFAYLRERAEAAGVFVLLIGNLGSHHSTLNVELFRGFAFADPIAPFVVINDQDSEQAWSFTLLHELAHIWLGQTGVSGGRPASAIETFCNDVAGRILLPTAEIAQEPSLFGASQEQVMGRISAIAEARQVSHSMVAYKLYREGIIDQETWSTVTTLFRQQWLRNRAAQRDRARENEGGPSYYTVKRHKLGNRLVELSKRMLAEGALSPSKAAAILGVRASNVYSLTDSAA
ncbi:Zn-dependent peptidase ImmA (M78 family)/transcriptional regulator with XRE-family HTH domain [Rhizobium sp. BK077]|uniref:ImmA/IrrE family metallo-endopeptidase n=1 Tax=unclassified Rhizobium TaxID=2613769 RepID=UPI00160F686A|nr:MULTISPECIES: XRE family transcriptional regulator [unclassified Rhizobium]MBB3302279.1 Zn-dependent peptidase ImmA (M78 family)/transcriptional regulator with XRE-family HTH domain [Rhizobium sp. BK112]MBB3371401.1 Zn-dependent peptidase ImmA (M78 family)/transcriptional regulator with XRE-family HTH domain [Rhizobium sp. BK077]MBB4182110.1 Zn-dependent peptidase ImmA (M78 family)/transcriptional regulator with XRE-family HTH domain [Rhizobium sp. BK109]MBB4255540.1 Zn-dependent peptidase I